MQRIDTEKLTIKEGNCFAPLPEEGDYYKENLLYCGNCNTPRQAIHEPFGTVSVQCRCREDAEARDERRRKRDALAERIADKSLIRHCFADDDRRYDLHAVYAYAEEWEDRFAKNRGLILTGDVGVGKTFAASCLVNALLDKGVSANIFSLGELTDVFGSYYTSEETKESYRSKIRHAKLIAIDEFDLAQKSDHVLGICFEIIDMRYRTDMPILITTNTMPKAIVTERSMIKRKIYDRIRTCEVAVIEGQSRRR